MTTPLLPIGKLAVATGVSVSALRHYDELGLVVSAQRVGGARHFSADAIGRVNFVRRAQRVGFSLAEIQGVLGNSSGETRKVVDDKIAALRAQHVELTTMINLLEEVRVCGCEAVVECPALANPC
jgi:MerR family redox-sensitive transcriptional activator SoxR